MLHGIDSVGQCVKNTFHDPKKKRSQIEKYYKWIYWCDMGCFELWWVFFHWFARTVRFRWELKRTRPRTNLAFYVLVVRICYTIRDSGEKNAKHITLNSAHRACANVCERNCWMGNAWWAPKIMMLSFTAANTHRKCVYRGLVAVVAGRKSFCHFISMVGAYSNFGILPT